MSEHAATPRPWEWHIYEGDRGSVKGKPLHRTLWNKQQRMGVLHPSYSEYEGGVWDEWISIKPADAEFIVRACNSFDDLLAAAKAFVSWVDDCWDSWAINDRDTPKAKADYEAAKAAIARAEAKQP